MSSVIYRILIALITVRTFCRHFKSRMNLMCEFVPQVLFLMSIFGYMNILIISKWFAFNSVKSGCAPSILITLINMFMAKYPEEPCSIAPMYDGQKELQTFLVILALICVPWMLVIKPFLIFRGRKQRIRSMSDRSPSVITHKRGSSIVNSAMNYVTKKSLKDDGAGQRRKSSARVHFKPDSNEENAIKIEVENEIGQEDNNDILRRTSVVDDDDQVVITFIDGDGKDISETRPSVGGESIGKMSEVSSSHDDEDEEGMGDIIIHQAIHTIEFCLGSISHTASYLRLWALSLAHAQLSEVLWNMVSKKDSGTCIHSLVD